MTKRPPPAADTFPSRWPTVAGVVVVLTTITSVLLVAFAWPSVRSALHGVPIAVAGPGTAADGIRTALEQRAPGAFIITRVDGTAEAEQLIRDRQIYGAVDLSSGTPRIIVASAASTAVAQSLQAMAAELAQNSNAVPAPVRDLAALPHEDPRGAGLAAAALPLVMAGLLAAVLLTRVIHGIGRRVTGALVFAATGGLAVVGVLQFWFGSLSGSYAANAAAVAATIAATGLTVLGLEALLGTAGIGIGAVTIQSRMIAPYFDPHRSVSSSRAARAASTLTA